MATWREQYLGGTRAAEEKIFEKYANDILELQQRYRENARAQQPMHGQHAKILCGISNAVLTIDEALPKAYRKGGLQPGTRFERCLVRLSNAAATPKADTEPDLRGLALRVPISEGDVLDLLMTNAQASHARTAVEFMALVRASTRKSRITQFVSLALQIGPFQAIRIARTLLGQTARQVHSVASEVFWSRAPFAVGDNAFQFFAVGQDDQAPNESARVSPDPHYLTRDLVDRLRRGPLTFKIWLRPFEDATSTPIEDGSVAWTNTSHDLAFGTLEIPAQDLTTDKAREAFQQINLTEFNPWHGEKYFRPIGNLNRARRSVYRHAADGRKLRIRPRTKEGLMIRACSGLGGLLNRYRRWDRWPLLLNILALKNLRDELRRHNLHDMRTHPPLDTETPENMSPDLAKRSLDGSFNDLTEPQMGLAGTSFGRNVPLTAVTPLDRRDILVPNPRIVSETFMARRQFVPASTLNVLAAGWIQFMIHDWFAHTTDRSDQSRMIRVPLLSDDPWRRGTDIGFTPETMDIWPTVVHKTIEVGDKPIPAYANRQSHWWDGAQLYGASPSRQKYVRSHVDGKLRFDDVLGLLELDPSTDQEVTGVTDNMWIGLSVMHLIFVQEHNAICDALKCEYPIWDDAKLFERARLINTALMTKIHTVEWTPAILGHPALKIAMRANWWGLLGPAIKQAYGRVFDSEELSGIISGDVDHHSADYSLTEEFVSVYRMHPLVPDNFTIYDAISGGQRSVYALEQTTELGTRQILQDETPANVIYSLGVTSPGAITLNNFPNFLRNLPRSPGSRIIDLAAVDIIRDRERGVPRYNDFREHLRKKRFRSFDEMTSDRELAKKLAEIYGNDVDKVDTMVGLFAETPPTGFGFSDTAFRIFILMASRRLKSDRLYNEDYNQIVYTKLGLDWVQYNDMRSVISRHYPALNAAMSRAATGFEPWRKLTGSEHARPTAQIETS